jgi:hypothetical protein
MLLPDGRSLMVQVYLGRARLVVAVAGPGAQPRDAQPLVQTDEETSTPAAALPGGQLAFMLGSGTQRMIAIASLTDGRIVRRLVETRGGDPNSLAASPDGHTLYYALAQTVWAIPAAGGQPRRIASGDSVAVHPNGQELVIQIVEAEGRRLVRVPVGGRESKALALDGGRESKALALDGAGEPRPIALHLPDGMRIDASLAANAVFQDGRIGLTVVAQDYFFYQAAVVDPATGQVRRIPVAFEGDVRDVGWTSDGKIVAIGAPAKGQIWRFRPTK